MLTQRNETDIKFSKRILNIGEGKIEEIYFDNEKLICLDRFKYVFTIQELNEIVYPQKILINNFEISKRAIVPSTNKNTDKINSVMLDQIEGDVIVPYSADTDVIDKDTHADNKHITVDMLNKNEEVGIPDHKIKFKIGALCTLIRNLHFDEGIVSGTKIVIKRVFRFLLEVY